MCVCLWVCTQDLNPALSNYTSKVQSLYLPPLLPQDSEMFFPLAQCSSEQGTEGLCLYQVLLFTMALNKYSAKASLQCEFVFPSSFFFFSLLKPEAQYCSVCCSPCKSSCCSRTGQELDQSPVSFQAFNIQPFASGSTSVCMNWGQLPCEKLAPPERVQAPPVVPIAASSVAVQVKGPGLVLQFLGGAQIRPALL